MTQPNPQISFTVILQPSVTEDQYLALLNVINEAANAYQHLFVNIVTNNIPPTLDRVPIQVEAQGIADPQLRALLTAALNNFATANPGVSWSFADAQT